MKRRCWSVHMGMHTLWRAIEETEEAEDAQKSIKTSFSFFCICYCWCYDRRNALVNRARAIEWVRGDIFRKRKSIGRWWCTPTWIVKTLNIIRTLCLISSIFFSLIANETERYRSKSDDCHEKRTKEGERTVSRMLNIQLVNRPLDPMYNNNFW